MNEFSVVGRRLPGIDAAQKATGRARYADDYTLSGMAFARIMRSPHPHARILNIDTRRAKRLPGVLAVVTAADVPDERQGLGLKDQPIFARDKVRYIGETMAGVVAIDEETAWEGMNLIDVQYEPLPAVFDPEEALEPGAPIIHEDLTSYEVSYQRTDESMRGNVAYHGRIHQGQPAEGFKASDFLFEDTFRTQKVHQCYLEPHCCLASFDAEGRVTVWTTTQRPHSNQVIIASLLRMPMNKIRVIPSVVGGGFGGKNRTLIEPICVALARKANRPVKLTLTREEEFTSATSRHPCIIRMKTGVKKDGTLLVRVVKLIYDCGAYMMVPNAIWLGAVNACGPYRIPNFEVNSYAAYTNKNMSAAFRGFGAPQVSFAYESQMDMIAERLGVDPVEIRLKNGMETGDSLPTGQAAASVEVKRTLTSAAKKAGWPEKKNSLGLASASFVCGGFVSSSFVRLNEDGTAVVASGAMDMGQGLRTVMAQIAAEELGLAFEDIVVVNADTDATPFDIGVFGDRGTNTAGMAVKMAAAEVKQEIVARAAALLEANVQDLEVRDGKIFVCGAPARAIALLDVLKGSQYLKGGPILGKASLMPEVQFSPPEVAQGQVTPFFRTVTFNSQLAEVKVDEETGTVKLTRLISCHDCGQAINPMGVEGQIDGGLVIGAGYGLYEQVIIDQGQVLNPGFTEYRMLTAADMPPMQGEIMAGADPTGPFGAKGAGNATLIPTAPAIANALYNAVGVRIKELPITPPKILDALEHCSKVKVHKAWAKLFV